MRCFQPTPIHAAQRPNHPVSETLLGCQSCHGTMALRMSQFTPVKGVPAGKQGNRCASLGFCRYSERRLKDVCERSPVNRRRGPSAPLTCRGTIYRKRTIGGCCCMIVVARLHHLFFSIAFLCVPVSAVQPPVGGTVVCCWVRKNFSHYCCCAAAVVGFNPMAVIYPLG